MQIIDQLFIIKKKNSNFFLIQIFLIQNFFFLFNGSKIVENSYKIYFWPYDWDSYYFTTQYTLVIIQIIDQLFYHLFHTAITNYYNHHHLTPPHSPGSYIDISHPCDLSHDAFDVTEIKQFLHY